MSLHNAKRAAALFESLLKELERIRDIELRRTRDGEVSDEACNLFYCIETTRAARKTLELVQP